AWGGVRVAPYKSAFRAGQMPEMDGLAAPAATRALHLPDRRDVWIIALTANAFEEDARRCLAAGMNDFLAKPIKPADLRACLARVPAGSGGRAVRAAREGVGPPRVRAARGGSPAAVGA